MNQRVNTDRALTLGHAGSFSIAEAAQRGAAAPGAQPARRVSPSAIGYLFAVAGLTWVLHDLHPAQLAAQLRHVNWSWIVAGMLCDVLSYLCQGWRWKLLLRPAGEISARQSTQVVYVSLFVNEVLPMRAGELVRAYLAARWTGATMLAIVPSMIVERLFDGLWMTIGLATAACFIPLPGSLRATAQTFGLMMLMATTLLIALAFRKSASTPQTSRLMNWPPLHSLALMLERISHHLTRMRRAPGFYRAWLLSLAFLGLQMLAFWMVLIGYGLRVPWQVAVVVFLIVHLSTAIPSAPGNAGSYQFFTVLGLTLFGVDKALATGFSLVVFVLLTAPLLLAGFVALAHSGLTLHSLRQEISATATRWRQARAF